MMNPIEIERNILRPAVDRVSLIGELDLVSDNRDGKSLCWWASDVINRVGERAQREGTLKHFPASLAIWFTERAQQPESNAFWVNMPDWVKQGKLGPEYIHALKALQKNDFQAVLVHSNKYVQAARIHALLSPFAIPELFRKVHAATKNGWDAGDLRNHLLELTSTSAVSVRYLLEYSPDQADDLLDRMIKSVKHPQLAFEMLPPHIAALADQSAPMRSPRGSNSFSQPRVHLNVLDYPELEVLLPLVTGAAWTLTGAGVTQVGVEGVIAAPTPPIVAQLSKDDPYTLVPKDIPVLVFSNAGRYIKSGVLPTMGGMLVINRNLRLNPDPYADLGRLKGAWHTHMAYVVSGSDFELLNPDGSLNSRVTSRSDINLEESIVQLLRFEHSQPIYSQVPKLLADDVLVIDNADGRAMLRMAGDYVVDADHAPHISLSLKGERLGDSYEIEGLVMPGTTLSASTTTLLPGYATHVAITLPVGWNGTDELDLSHGDDCLLTVCDATGQSYELSLELPSLSWTVNDRREDTPQWTAETLLGSHSDLTQFEGLRIYHGEPEPPRVSVLSGGRFLQNLVPENQGPSSQASSHSYDLRSVHGLARTNIHEAIEVHAYVCTQEITLIRISTKAKQREWKSVSLRDFASEVGYTEDEMREARQDNYAVDANERRERDRRLTENLRKRSRRL